MTYNPDYFYYKGQHYGSGTFVTLKDEYINSHTYNGKKIWKGAMFLCKITEGNIVQYSFNIRIPKWYDMQELGITQQEIDECAVSFRIDALMLEEAIEEITKPIYPPANVKFVIPGFHDDMTPVKDWEVPSLMMAWMIFIMVSIGLLVFQQGLLLWPIVCFIFNKIRNEMLNR
jgi:hypothetical protein